MPQNYLNRNSPNSLIGQAEDYGTLPIKNQYGQYQVGGDLGGREGVLDQAFEVMPFVGDARALDRAQEAARPTMQPDLMGGAQFRMNDPRTAAFETATAMPAVGDVATLFKMGAMSLPGIIALMARKTDDVIGLARGPLRSQAGIIGYHGSPHKVDKLKYVKPEGRGGSSFGKGINVATDPNHAKVYSGDGGYLYEVDIPDDIANKTLDWNKPLSEQPDYVKKAMADIDLPKLVDGQPFGDGGKIVRDGDGWSLSVGDANFKLSSADIKRMFGDDMTGEQIYRRLEGSVGSSDEAQRILKERGIKGTRFSESGYDNNFVVFDENNMNILTRNGEPVAQSADSPKTWYRGGKELDPNSGEPLFFTTDKSGADWFTAEKGGATSQYAIQPKNPLSIDSKEGLQEYFRIAKESGVDFNVTGEPFDMVKGWRFESGDIPKYSPYEGENVADMLYIPKFRESLKANGYDAITFSDVLENTEIPAMVPLDNSLISRSAQSADLPMDEASRMARANDRDEYVTR